MLAPSEGLAHLEDPAEMELRQMAEANEIEAALRLGRRDNIPLFQHVPLDAVVQRSQDVEAAYSSDNELTISFGDVVVS